MSYEPIGCVDKEGLLPDSTQHKRGLLGWRVTPLMYGGETSVGEYILGDSLEKPHSDLLAHTPEICKVPMGTGERDDHDSWVKCTNSSECQTKYSAMLTVMSGMDPHMISRMEVKGDMLHIFPFEKLLFRSFMLKKLAFMQINPRE